MQTCRSTQNSKACERVFAHTILDRTCCLEMSFRTSCIEALRLRVFLEWCIATAIPLSPSILSIKMVDFLHFWREFFHANDAVETFIQTQEEQSETKKRLPFFFGGGGGGESPVPIHKNLPLNAEDRD